jgi:hypothetical protein
MSQFPALVLSVALVAAVWTGYLLGRDRQSLDRPEATPAEFVRRLSRAEPISGLRVYRGSSLLEDDALFLSDHALTPGEVGALPRNGDADPRWQGIFRLVRDQDAKPGPSDVCSFSRGGLTFYSGDPAALAEARRYCDRLGW